METEEIDAVLEKIWDLHDKLSDAIHSISHAHFLNSIKAPKKYDKKKPENNDFVSDEKVGGFVFVKDFRVEQDVYSSIQKAKSLNTIRTAVENQLEFFHVQQRAQRDASIERIEQSRIILAMRLAEHHGKKYKVIEEAQAFVGDVRETSCFVSPENLYGPPFITSGENVATREGKWHNILMNAISSSFNIAKKSFKFDNVGGVLGNAALVALSMIVLLQFHQLDYKDHHEKAVDEMYVNRRVKRNTVLASNHYLGNLDVLLARG